MNSCGLFIVTVLAAVAAQPALSACDSGLVSLKVDRFTGAAGGSTHLLMPTTDTGAVLYMEPTPNASWSSALPDLVLFQVSLYSVEWAYTRCHEIAVLVDGKKVAAGASSHDGDVIDSRHLRETVASPLRLADFPADFEKFEYRICNSEHQSPEGFVCQLRALVRQAREWRAAHPEPKRKKG
jgi:hypothetical protein